MEGEQNELCAHLWWDDGIFEYRFDGTGFFGVVAPRTWREGCDARLCLCFYPTLHVAAAFQRY